MLLQKNNHVISDGASVFETTVTLMIDVAMIRTFIENRIMNKIFFNQEIRRFHKRDIGIVKTISGISVLIEQWDFLSIC